MAYTGGPIGKVALHNPARFESHGERASSKGWWSTVMMQLQRIWGVGGIGPVRTTCSTEASVSSCKHTNDVC